MVGLGLGRRFDLRVDRLLDLFSRPYESRLTAVRILSAGSLLCKLPYLCIEPVIGTRPREFGQCGCELVDS